MSLTVKLLQGEDISALDRVDRTAIWATFECRWPRRKPVVLAWASVEDGVPSRRLLDRTNENGGAIAIGHPLGASGARIMTTLVNAVHQQGGRYGLHTMCEGGGKANATIIERWG